MKKNIEFFIKTCIAATFFVPLVLVPSSFIFPFIVPKILLFRCLVLLMLGGYILLLLHNFSQYKPKKTWINYAVGLFFLSFAISTFTGLDWYHSFWDNHERMLGLFTIFHYVVYYFVISSVMKEWRSWRVLLYLFLLAGSVVMAIGFYQKGHPNFLLNQGSNRVASTLGNPIYVGGYGLFLAFLGLLLFLKEKKNNIMRFVAAFGMILGLVGVFLSGTRGTLLGLLAGIGLLCLIYFLSAKAKSLQKRFFGGLILLGLILMASIFAFRETEFVRHIPTVGRLANTSISAGTASTRLMAWGIAIDAWKERPVFGWGPNNYFYAFNKYYRPEFLRHGWNETWFDNAHSSVMNTFAVQGTVGGVLYFAMFIMSILTLRRAHKSGLVELHTAAVGVAFLVGHFVHNAFVFENPTSYLYFFFFLGFVNSQTSVHDMKSTGKTMPFSLMKTAGVSLVILLFLYSTNINPARANTATLNSLRVLNSAKVFDLSLYDDVFGIPSPHIDDIRNDFVRSSLPIFNSDLKKLQESYGQDVNKFFDFVIAGDGKEKKNIEREIKEKKLENIVTLCGFVQDASLFLSTLDVFVLPSRKEGMPYTLLEAEFAHIPTIATRVGGIPEIIEDKKTGLLVDPSDVDGLARAMLYAYQNTGEMKKMAANDHPSQNSKFIMENMVKETTSLYLDLLKKPE